jgi:type II secretory pathway component GspD/PulD (secretin)
LQAEETIMQPIRCSLAIVGLLCLASTGLAQVAPVSIQAGRMVSIEVVIVEFDAHEGVDVDLGAPDKALERLRELEEQGEIDGLTRAHLSTLELQPATVKVGAQEPFVIARMRGPAGAGGGGSSTAFENLGTMITITPRVAGDGAVVAELKLEKSNFRRANKDAASPDDVMPPRKTSITLQSTLRIPAGQTAIVGGLESAGKEGSGQALVLVSARVSDGPAPEEGATTQNATTAGPGIRIFSLRNAAAQEAAILLTTLFKTDGMHVGVDERTNSVLVRAPKTRLEEVEAVLLRLDEQDKVDRYPSTNK